MATGDRERYSECVRIAKSYYALLKARAEIERDVIYASASGQDGMPKAATVGDPTARKAAEMIRAKADIDCKIRAIQSALESLPDDCARQFIRQNIFRGIPMHWCNLPMSIPTRKRIRSRFIRALARMMEE